MIAPQSSTLRDVPFRLYDSLRAVKVVRPCRPDASTVTALAPPPALFVWLHAGAIHCRWRELRIVAITRQPENQEFFATIANHIDLGTLPAKPEILGIRDFCFLCASLTPVIQKIIVTIKTV